MQMVINLAQVSFRNKKVNFYTCSRLTFLKKKCHYGKCLKERCVCPQKLPDPSSGSRLRRSKLTWSGLFLFKWGLGWKCSEILPTIKLLYNPRVNIVFTSSCSEVWLRPRQIDDSYQTQPEIAHGNVMCVRVLCWNIQWNNILSSYCCIAAICRALWNEIRKESYNNTTGWQITLPQGLAPKCHKGDVIMTSVSIYSWLFHSCFVFLVVSAHWCHAT